MQNVAYNLPPLLEPTYGVYTAIASSLVILQLGQGSLWSYCSQQVKPQQLTGFPSVMSIGNKMQVFSCFRPARNHNILMFHQL